VGNNQNNNNKKPHVYKGQVYDNFDDWFDAVDRDKSGKSEQEQKTERAKAAAMENQSFLQASQGKDPYVNPTTPIEEYDPIIAAEYQDAISAIEGVNGNKPLGNMSFTAQLQNIYNQIVNREKFTFDVNSDAMYQQMKDSYIAQGKLAAADVMGQAAAMNGGYGSSYGQSVGQQTYQGYMKQLNDNIPDLYSMALDRYNQEGQDMIDRASVLEGLAAEEYADFVAKLSRGENVTEEEMAAVGLTATEVESLYDQIEAENQPSNKWQYTLSEKAIDANDSDTYTDRSTGKTIRAPRGYNPYTGDVNEDIKNGTFAYGNSYQPNNVDGHKLVYIGLDDINANGDKRRIFAAPSQTGSKSSISGEDGKLTVDEVLNNMKFYIWNDFENEYDEYQINEDPEVKKIFKEAITRNKDAFSKAWNDAQKTSK
jgi:hypothetical protein